MKTPAWYETKATVEAGTSAALASLVLMSLTAWGKVVLIMLNVICRVTSRLSVYEHR